MYVKRRIHMNYSKKKGFRSLLGQKCVEVFTQYIIWTYWMKRKLVYLMHYQVRFCPQVGMSKIWNIVLMFLENQEWLKILSPKHEGVSRKNESSSLDVWTQQVVGLHNMLGIGLSLLDKVKAQLSCNHLIVFFQINLVSTAWTIAF